MRIFEAARRPSDWMRAALAILLLAFALNTIAHAAHTHDSVAPAVAHHAACGYCATFGSGLSDAPVHSNTVVAVFTSRIVAPATLPAAAPRPPETLAQPRAPPVL